MDTLFFWVSKLAWLVVAPDHLLLIMLLLAWPLYMIGKTRAAIGLTVFAGLSLVLIALFPVGSWLLAPLESRFESSPQLPGVVDGIVVLGGAESLANSAYWKQVELNDSGERLLAFIELAASQPGYKGN